MLPFSMARLMMMPSLGAVSSQPLATAAISSALRRAVLRLGKYPRVAYLDNGRAFKGKIGAAVVAARRGGATHVFDTINHFFTIGQMIIVSSSYWNIGVGRNIGDVDGDEEGIKTMRDLGSNMAWLLKKLQS